MKKENVCRKICRCLVLSICTVALVLLCQHTLFVQSFAATENSGTCGTNATWKLSDGVLTISGTGAMSDYKSASAAPWYNDRMSINVVAFENGITNIGNYAFYGYSNLMSVTIPSSVTAIGKYAFYNCSGLVLDTVGDNVNTIGTCAFYGCSGLTNITIGDSVTTIGSNAFYGCNSLTEVTIGKGVTTINSSAFYGCSSLTSVTIPEGVTTIGYYVFESCSALKSVTIPSSVSDIGYGAFYRCYNLTDVYISDIAAWCNILFGNNEANPLFYADNLYLNGDVVRDLVIPNNVTSIGARAFYNYAGLETVTIPNSVEYIGNKAFATANDTEGTIESISLSGFSKDAFTCSAGATNQLTAYRLYRVRITKAGETQAISDKSLSAYDREVTTTFSVRSPGVYYLEYCNWYTEYYWNGSSMVQRRVEGDMYKREFTATGLENKGRVLKPIVREITGNSITLTQIVGYEYSIDGVNWQTSNVICDLQPMTNYTVYQRIAEESNVYASDYTSIKVKTTLPTPDAPGMPQIEGFGRDWVALVANATYEYSLDGVTWQNSNKFTNLKLDVEYTFYQRIKKTASANASLPSQPISFTIEGRLFNYGDVNADNSIDGRDVITLCNYLADYDVTTDSSSVMVYAGADANGDSYINEKDVLIICEYLANYDYEKDSSSVVLGKENASGSRAATAKSITLSTSSASAYRGDTISVTVNVTSKNSLAFLMITPNYDSSALTLVETINGTVCSNMTNGKNPNWHSNGADVTATGTLVTFKFKVNDSAAFADHTVGVTVRECYNAASEKVTVYTSAGKVTVNCKHNYNAWNSIDGNQHMRVCDICKNSENANHTWNTGSVTKPATCKEIGIKTFTCTVCNGTKTEDIPKSTVHSYGDWIKVSDSTHSRTCDICLNVENANHAWNQCVVVAPTDIQQGYTQYTCACGDFYRQNYTNALGLAAPQLLVSIDTESGKPVFNWTGGGEGITYEIHRATSKSGKYTKVATVSESSWMDTSASVGKTYYYKVKAVYTEDTSLSSGFSAVVSATAKCATPELTVEAGSAGKPVLTWNKITGAKKYEIWRSVDGGAFKKLTTITKLTYTDSKATAGAECTYKVKALGSKSAYNGEFSNADSCYVTCAAPSLTLKLDSKTGMPSLSWKKITGAKSYAIYRCQNGGEYKLLTTTTAVSYIDKTAAPDNQYSYYVVTLGKAEVFNSVASALKTVTLAVKAPKLTGSNNAAGAPIVNWAAVENAVSYKVYRSTKSSKGFVLVQTTEGLTYTDTSVAVGKTYYYKVVAVGANTESAMSSYLKLTGKCATPTIQVSVNEDSGKPVITWEKITGAKKYTVYRATSENGKYTKQGTSKTTSYTDTKASVGTKYFYKIVANPSSSSANSLYSNIESCLTICAKAVVTVKVDAASGKPSLSWKKVTGAKSYAIYRSENGGEYILVATQTAVSYKDNAAVAGNTYSYQVKVIASKSGCDSFLSAEKTVTATCATPKLTGKVGANNKPVISWAEVEGATKYVVYRSTKSSKGYTVIGEAEGLSYEDLTAAKGKTYYYKVVAVGDSVESAQSSYAKVKSK